MELSKLTSAIINDVQSGLSGMNANPTLPYQQIQDEVLEVRDAVLKELWLKGLLRKNEVVKSINCVEIDCKDSNRCPCMSLAGKKPLKHFEIPPLVTSLGEDAIEYIGATDRTRAFKVYFSRQAAEMHHYRSHGANRPYVYVECTPNENGMFDCWLFGAPMMQNIAVIGIFKDPRKLAEYNCCGDPEDYEDLGSISNEIKNRIVQSKIKLYRQYLMPAQQTDLQPR